MATMMNGDILTGAERLDLSCKCFQFVLDRIFDPGVECVGLPVCASSRACSKTKALSRFARQKFEFEERMMTTSAYPNFGAHVSDHRRLISRLEAGPEAEGCGGWLSWIREIADDWALNHMKVHDETFRKWVG